jgi:hypothetical protein
MRLQSPQKGSLTGVDEADAPAPVGEAVDPRRGARLARLGLERIRLVDRRPDLVARQHGIGRPRVVSIERHELDEAHLVGVLAGEAREGQDLRLGEAAHGHGVDLDRVRLGEARERLEPAQDLGQRVAAGHREEAVALQGVDGDVEAPHAGADERLGVALQEVAVRRDREVVQAVDRGQHRDEARQLTAHERLAAREPHVAHAHRRQQRDEPGDLLEAQDLVSLEPGQARGGHAVLAAEVAAVGDRDAHVADQAAVAVAEGLALGRPCHFLQATPLTPAA